jgi:hypothetical protein
MSWEAWGDDDDGYDYDHLLEAGWWTSEQASAVTEAIKALVAEQLYETPGAPATGVSVAFLARLTILRAEAGLLSEDDPLVIEARALLTAKETGR